MIATEKLNTISPNHKSKQPTVFMLSIIVSVFERFGFYILADSLVLYLEKSFGFLDHEANIFYSTLNALTYSAPAIGGYLADNVLGIRRSIVLGLFLEGLGQICLVFSDKAFLYLGIALVVTGVGFFKTAPTNLMARAYEENDPRIDSGYTLFYMAINMGSALSAILAGFLQKSYGWHMIFLVASIGTYIGLLFYFIFKWRAHNLDVALSFKKLALSKILIVSLSVIVAVLAIAFLMYKTIFAQITFYVIAACLVSYLAYEIYKSSREERRKIIAAFLLILVGMVFFMMYFQRYTSVLLFMDRVVDRSLFGVNVPSIAMLALNPLWIIFWSPILVLIYNNLHKKKKDLSITTKFPLGLLIISLTFISLKVSTFFVDGNNKISFIWIVLAFGLYSLGELLISALGVAMVARIAPKRMYGVMMGAWYLLASSIGCVLGGYAANFADIPKNLTDPAMIIQIYGRTFFVIGIMGLLITFIAFIAGSHIKRIADL